MCNPTKFSTGKVGLITGRKNTSQFASNLTRVTLDANGRFARDIEYLLTAQYAVDSKQVADDAIITVRQTQEIRCSLQDHK